MSLFPIEYSKVERKTILWTSILLLLCLAIGTYFSFYWIFLLPFAVFGIFWAVVDWRSFYWFFLFSIPFSVEVFLPGGLATSVPDEPIMWFFLLVTLFMLATGKRYIPDWFWKDRITFWLAVHFVWMTIAVIMSEIFLPSFKYFLAKSWYLNAFFVFPVLFFKTKEDFIRAFKLIYLPFVLVFVIIILHHSYLNFGFVESNMAARPFFMNHVDHSTILSMSFPMFIIAYQLNKGKKYIRLFLLLVILFLIPATFLAQARAAILAIIFALVIWWCFNRNLGKLIMPAFYALIITIVSLVISNNNYVSFRPDFKHTYTQPNFSSLLKATVAGTDMSSMERLYRWIASARMSQERPLLGVGPNNWYEFYKSHTLSEFKTYVSRNPERSTTHNYFVFMLTEQGWPALIIYGILVWVVMNYAQKLYQRLEDPFYKKVTLGLAMTFGAGFVNNFFSELLETHKIGALFFMSMSLLVIINGITNKQNSSKLQ